MPTYTLTQVSDEKLMAGLAALVAADRQTTAMLLAHIAEVDARELFAPAACSSMHVYCVRVLHLSEDAAFKRIRAARAARRHPQIFDAVADGRLHLSGVGLLAAHFTDENVDELIAAAAHRSKAEIEMLVARLAPRADMPAAITPIVPPAEPPSTFQLAPGPVASQQSDAVSPPRVTPLAPERFALQMTIDQATRDKLERARALLRHQNPSGDLATVVARALDALLAELERKKFAATSRPRAGRARRENADQKANPRAVSNEVKRGVHARDGEQCTFVSESGERCTEHGFLEIDHRTPVARNGQPTVENLRMLCRAHNQYEAARILGADVVRAGRRRAKPSRATPSRAKPSACAPQPRPRRRGDEIQADGASTVESDVARALCDLGFRPAEVRRAMASTADMSATTHTSAATDTSAPTVEQRLRAVLAELTRSRCSDGPFDRAVLTGSHGWRTADI